MKLQLSILFKFIIVLTGTFGLLAQLGVFHGAFNASLFHYFTVLSNLFCVFYFTADLIYLCTHRTNGEKKILRPAVKGTAMMSITLTMLVAHFVLGSRFSMGSTFGLSMLAVHYIVPVMVILDWLFFDPKGLIQKSSPLLWTIAPLAYFIYAMIAAQIGDGIGFFSRYPYSFMDADKLGWPRVFLNSILLLIGFIVLGYGFYGIDRMLFIRSLKWTIINR